MTLIPAQITFRGFDPSDALEADIRERITWLEQFHGGIVGCRVVVEVPHRRRGDGRHFHVRVEMTVPGSPPIIVSHQPSLHGALKDVAQREHHKETEIRGEHQYARVAVHEAFDAARRRLQDVARERRGAVKTHDTSVQQP